MTVSPAEIFGEYKKGYDFKNAIGEKGFFEQAKINERFYLGDQWYKSGRSADRPLVRHNVIKRIGDFKMAHILSDSIAIRYSSEGVPVPVDQKNKINELKSRVSSGEYRFEGEIDSAEINFVMDALSAYRNGIAEKIGFDALCEKAVREAFISGGSVIYTYWQGVPENGIKCEVIPLSRVYFAEPFLTEVEDQPYIIISAYKNADEVKREAIRYGKASSVKDIERDSVNGLVLTLTKIYKDYRPDGSFRVLCVKSTEHAIIRAPFDTNLRLYPIALFNFNERRNCIYGESEITNLIPNQIAINRMITANVWSQITVGMPIMVVNGDTVPQDVSNDPGQIVKIYGSNEDVRSAIGFVSPPDVSENFCRNIDSLIQNTLAQSGANEAALGDANPNNASAISALQNAALMPMKLLKARYHSFLEKTARIWADFWTRNYKNKNLRIEDENGVWFVPFDGERYENLVLNARVDIVENKISGAKENFNALITLFDKGIINKKQLISRLPDGIIIDRKGLLLESEEN